MSEFENPINAIIKRAWLDPEFKAELMANPKKVLAEFDVDIDEDNVKIYENTSDVKHLVLPKLPDGPELTDGDLERLIRAGATCAAYASVKGTCL